MYIYQKVVLFLNVQRSNKHYFFVNRGILRILWLFSKENHCTKKWIFSTKNFFVKSDQIRSFLWIWSHLLKKSLMEKFIFCPVNQKTFTLDVKQTSNKLHQTKYWHFVQIFFDKQYLIHCSEMTFQHCVKSVQIWSFFWYVFSRIWTLFTEC